MAQLQAEDGTTPLELLTPRRLDEARAVLGAGTPTRACVPTVSVGTRVAQPREWASAAACLSDALALWVEPPESFLEERQRK
ncbi:MAG: hypothetical protein AMXMBFR64_59520 [Myxococcales bacterium]